ncbi:MAG: DMT family transporter [Kiloniellales bacterium]|nr:DMT family transporter [Kiloniellales bacterium]
MAAPKPAAGAAEAGRGAALDLAPPRRLFAMTLMVVSSVLISFGGLIMRNMEQADTWQINFYRALAIIVAVGLILAAQHGRRTFASIRKIGRAGLWGGALLAVAGIAILQALAHTTVANTLFTLSAIPFITAALARIFLKETLQRATLLTMMLAAVGIFVMVSEGVGQGSGYGNAMALVCALGFAGFAVIVRHNRRIDMLPTMLVSAGIIALVSLAVRWDDLGLTVKDLLLCLLWGGVLSGFANWMFIVASRHLVAAEVTLFMLLEFSLGPVWVWLFVGEEPTRWTILGGLLVIGAVALRALIELKGRGRRLKRGRPSPG